MELLGLLFVLGCLCYGVYETYRLWKDPHGYWKWATGKRARLRAKSRGTILSLFDIDMFGLENNRDRYIFVRKLFLVLYIIVGILVLITLISGPLVKR